MPLPKWMTTNLSNPTLAADALRKAADAANACRATAAKLNAAGRDHTSDSGWQTQVRASHELADAARRFGFSDQDVMNEAAHRRVAT
ncbi:hypothetical protein [Streptomyces sp. enrichment culture]|uniref:hypothetical protein n=1 Tax=Streptomyces sp. enrichment culture TaxID=1795815 RepID=UPI003F552FCA